MNTGSSSSPNNMMVTFLEPSSTNTQDQGGLNRLDHPTSETIDDAHQQDEDKDLQLSFRNTGDNHPHSPSFSACGHVKPPRIAG